MSHLRLCKLGAVLIAVFTLTHGNQAFSQEGGIGGKGQPKVLGEAIQQLQETTNSVKQTGEAVQKDVKGVAGEVADVKGKVDDAGKNIKAAQQGVNELMGAVKKPKKTQTGAVLVTQERALAGDITVGDAPGFPVSINEPGSYALASNLTVFQYGVTAIEITVDHVSLDMSGFSIFGPGSGGGEGISAPPGVGGNSVVIMNGIIRDIGSNGIRLDSKVKVQDLQVIFSGADGINVTSGAMILNTIANDNGGRGIVAGSDSRVSGVGVAVNLSDGISVGSRSLVTDSVVTRNGGLGLTGADFGYSTNVFSANNGGGSNPQVMGGVELGGNLCGSGVGC